MMKNGLTTVQKRLILIFGGLLIMLGVIVFVFQKNMKQANRLENDTNEKINEVNYLSDLQRPRRKFSRSHRPIRAK